MSKKYILSSLTILCVSLMSSAAVAKSLEGEVQSLRNVFNNNLSYDCRSSSGGQMLESAIDRVEKAVDQTDQSSNLPDCVVYTNYYSIYIGNNSFNAADERIFTLDGRYKIANELKRRGACGRVLTSAGSPR
jgi:hypothetical protein